jgi:organic radical activating enzyme
MIVMAAMPDGSPEIFTSIQGEGPSAGRLSTFARLSACNLYCGWCDTPYTWRWTDAHPHADNRVFERKTWQTRLTSEDLHAAISSRGARRAIFTGGEPLLQHRALLPVVRALREDGFAVEFETNGTVLPPREFTDLATLLVVSPKLSNSGIPVEDRLNRDALGGLARLDQTAWKFVVTSTDDMNEVDDRCAEFGVDPDRVWIMPCGRTAEETTRVGRLVIGRLMQSGYNYSARLHLPLFGEKQGT